MRDVEVEVLGLFKIEPSREFDTSDIARSIFKQEYEVIDKLLESTDKQRVQDAKRQRFQLHRKLLYYLNKLVSEDILKVSRTKEKGEKAFVLAVEEGDITIGKGYKKIVITKPTLATNQIESYENKKIMKKYEEDAWITKLNAIVIECSNNPTLQKITGLVRQVFSSVNDVVALNNFETILNTLNAANDLRVFLESMASETSRNDKTISILINVNDVESNALRMFLELYTIQNPGKINVVYNIDTRELNRNSKIFEELISYYSKFKIKLNIRNTGLSTSPYFKGRAGIYTFDDEEWKYYQKHIKSKVFGISCSQSTIAVNIEKFFEIHQTDKEFRDAVLSAAKVLLSANTIQRRKSNEYFKIINNLNTVNAAEFYRFSRNYIRFWNYDWHKNSAQNTYLLELIRSTKEMIDNFCITEETIYKSCGIPIRFRIAFSSAFRNYDAQFMGERDYKKANVKKSEDLHQGEIKEFIEFREKMFEIFDGGDRMRVFRTMDFKISDIVHELYMLLSTYKIPFFTYDFSTMKGIVKLTSYI